MAQTAERRRFPAQIDDDWMPRFAIGDRVSGPVHGVVVDLQTDAVVVARRNAHGRSVEVVFVGDAINTLRPA